MKCLVWVLYECGLIIWGFNHLSKLFHIVSIVAFLLGLLNLGLLQISWFNCINRLSHVFYWISIILWLICLIFNCINRLFILIHNYNAFYMAIVINLLYAVLLVNLINNWNSNIWVYLSKAVYGLNKLNAVYFFYFLV